MIMLSDNRIEPSFVSSPNLGRATCTAAVCRGACRIGEDRGAPRSRGGRVKATPGPRRGTSRFFVDKGTKGTTTTSECRCCPWNLVFLLADRPGLLNAQVWFQNQMARGGHAVRRIVIRTHRRRQFLTFVALTQQDWRYPRHAVDSGGLTDLPRGRR